MGEVGRGALVGLAAGGVQAGIWAVSPPWDGHSGVDGPYSMPMTAALFLLGAGLAAVARLPRWPLVALAGCLATLFLGGALWGITPETSFYDFDRSLLGVVHVVSAVTAFAAAAATRWWTWLGLIALVCALAVPLEEPAWRWHLARAFERVGVPLVAPDVPGHRLHSVSWPSVGGGHEPVLDMEYRRPGAEADGSLPAVQVIVRRDAAGTAGQACARPYHLESWAYSGGHCRAASEHHWVRSGRNGRIAVFTRAAGALIQLESHRAGERTLLSAARAIHPISPETLAQHVHPIR
ncbi:hypothetical protein [Nonomuraea aridisoli]|uniref:Uncharacterized protein n=1 Tax=Nonomuraea aridisoli TaxID=2070368 RepID=A0A2W2F5H3_9ACTN|nr:hypothetical protein [Nonomuraea aridisoli]PZG16847.1 hypothetical protein C1J01_19790 [Nonomuraea aridisoli]